MREYSKTIGKRLQAMGVFFILFAAMLFWRMYDIAYVNHVKYLDDAQSQQRTEKIEIAARGKILVHDSVVDKSSYYPLAFDIKKFSVWVVPNQVKADQKQNVANELESLLSIPSKDIFDKINNNKMYIPALKKSLTMDEADKVDAKNLPGVYLTPEYSRFYPEISMASQLLGFVNYDGDGKYGFEGHYNNELKGKDGGMLAEKDTFGRVISLLDQKDPQDGTSYVLTIDRSVQYFIEKKLAEAITTYKADSGTIIIEDIATGGIVGMASFPTYDPNKFAEVAGTNQALFVNPAIGGFYEPGSIFKPIIMSLAINGGFVTPETENVFGADVVVDGFTIKTAERKAFGKENMTQVLKNSDNVAMTWISSLMGKEKMYEGISNYRFTDKTGIDLDGEVNSLVRPAKSWSDITRSTTSFGQGIAITPIQILSAYATMANGGKYLFPHIVDKIVYNDGTEKQVEKQEGEQVITKQTADSIATMLTEVVNSGSSYRRIKQPGFLICAKTGTAQISAPEGGYLSSEDGLGIYTHSVAGFAPAKAPKYAMLVKLDKPKSAMYAESTAAPLFGEISSFLLNYYYRVPTTEPIN
jgi:cell division protein FtsI/penicillin-binding protein 2